VTAVETADLQALTTVQLGALSAAQVGALNSRQVAALTLAWNGQQRLKAAELEPAAKQVLFDGMDKPVTATIPDFVKSIELDQALDPDLLLATEMNGQPLPWLNGVPLRLVVPGDISERMAASRSLNDFVEETNRVGHHLFAPDCETLLARLGRTTGR
jgi:hypothetical protein